MCSQQGQAILDLVTMFSVNPKLAKERFNDTIRTPKDLSDFTHLVKSTRRGEGGRAIKTAAGRWLAVTLSSEYGEELSVAYAERKRPADYSLRDMIRMYHPKTGPDVPLFDYLLGRHYDPEALPLVAAYERSLRR